MDFRYVFGQVSFTLKLEFDTSIFLSFYEDLSPWKFLDSLCNAEVLIDLFFIFNSHATKTMYSHSNTFNNLKDLIKNLKYIFYCLYWILNHKIFLIFYQAEIGSISSDIKILQEKSMDMSLRLKNRKVWMFNLDKKNSKLFINCTTLLPLVIFFSSAKISVYYIYI